MTDLEKMQKIVIDNSCHHEYLYHFIDNVKEYFPNLSEEQVKKKVLTVIKILLKKGILNIHNFADESKWNSSVEESVKKINELWFAGATYLDFLDMIFFTRQDWFHKKLKEEGYNFQDNWSEFVKKTTWLKDLLCVNEIDYLH